MRNGFLFLLAVLTSSISFAQRMSIGQIGGYEFSVGKKGGSGKVYNFNQNMVFGQPVAFGVQLNNKFGIQADIQIGICLVYRKVENLELPSPAINDPFVFKSDNYVSNGYETVKLRLGMFYNIEQNKWSFKPKLLAGVFILEADRIQLTLKEKNTNNYFSDVYRPGSESLNLFLVSGGLNVGRALSSRFSLTAEAMFSHARKDFPVSRTLTNLYTNQESGQTFSEKIRLNSIALGLGFLIKIGRIKVEEDLLRE
ncbi:hypothetical protein [Dyadobacter psychrotolerans]|uniref:Outer membrane protein beta-barrel domain-containing protein n=1 Tax=Dyadobacter psychrotolerans TaxID=2541721 RepID=A0A4R5DQ55_9BACT|nr:hypothetical protein [Dyadobacter psychrotolerans]TDE12923.1 hypothetical protein E0F88_21545 [Dyadobacter psychrotolerans]